VRVCNSIFFFLGSSSPLRIIMYIYLQNITLCALHTRLLFPSPRTPVYILYSITKSPVYNIHISPTVVHLSCVCVCACVRVCGSAAYTCCCWRKKRKIIIIMTTIIIKNRKLTFLLTRGVLTPTCSRIAYER